VTARLIRITIALVSVALLQWIYSLAIVPWIEPSVYARNQASSSEAERAAARNINRRYLDLFAAYFPPDHWAQKNPKVVVNDQVMLLIDDYNPLDDGLVELRPCVMIFFPDAPGKEFRPQRRAILLDAPGGAMLKFDKGLDLAHAKIGRLEYGQLDGEITIHSDMRKAGRADDLQVKTRDVQITPGRIWTRHDVQFRLGENRGHGSELEIRLLPPENQSRSGLSIGGLQSLQLSRNVQMNLAMGDANLLPSRSGGAKGDTPAKDNADGDAEKQSAPVEVTCRGPFYFDLVGNVATFEDQVDVLRLNPGGPADQMTCELLSVFFASKDETKKKAGGEEDSSDLAGVGRIEPTRLEARGAPVIVRSPASKAAARCEHLTYQLDTRKIELASELGVVLTQEKNEIHAPAVHYQPHTQPGKLGNVWAAGPGWLRAASTEKPEESFDVRWETELQLARHDGVPVISVLGRPRLAKAGMGRLDADEVHLWLREHETAPPATAEDSNPQVATPDAGEVEPDRLLATGQVEIHSPRLTGETERLEAWFGPEGDANKPRAKPRPKPAPQAAPELGGSANERALAPRPKTSSETAALPGRAGLLPSRKPGADAGSAEASLSQWSRRSGQPTQPRANTAQAERRSTDGLQETQFRVPATDTQPRPAHQPPPGANGADAQRQPPPSSTAPAQYSAVAKQTSRYEIQGDIIRLQVLLQDKQAEVSDVTVGGNVEVREAEVAKPGQKPLVIRGDLLEMDQVHRESTRVKVSGEPAHVEARGMTLEGAQIDLDRGANRLWIDGRGMMTLPAKRGEEESSPPAPDEQTLRIDWRGKMNFDGQVMTFREQVVAQTEERRLQTEQLEVELAKRIDFSGRSQSPETEVHRVTCRDGVLLVSRSFREGQLESIDRLAAQQLNLNETSGDLEADGPGWMTSVRQGNTIAAAGGRTKPVSTSAVGTGGDEKKLSYLHVDFHRGLQGNTKRRQITFVGKVQTVYGPVDDWDDTLDGKNPDSLGPRGVVMDCDRLTVTEVKPPGRKRGAMELAAAGNTRVDGQTFTARAAVIRYTQAKELLVLESDGWQEARLWRQQHVGGPTSYAAAEKILYWRRTGRVQIQNARDFGGQAPVRQ